jgi:hypothetical protein
MRALRIRFYIDPSTGAPHILNHRVGEDEVADVLEGPGEDRAGGEAFQDCLGADRVRPLSAGYLRARPRAGQRFVITAYDLTGKPLAAYSRRRKKKVQ